MAGVLNGPENVGVLGLRNLMWGGERLRFEELNKTPSASVECKEATVDPRIIELNTLNVRRHDDFIRLVIPPEVLEEIGVGPSQWNRLCDAVEAGYRFIGTSFDGGSRRVGMYGWTRW